MSTAVQNATSVEFGADHLKANAKQYTAHKAVIDAIAKGISRVKGGYETFDDAIALVREAWESLEDQVKRGAGYTPDRDLGFGSNSARQVAEDLLGLRPGVSATRTQFNKLGK